MVYDFSKVERDMLEFWSNDKTFDKLVKKNKGKETWSFLDGPITANNPMGIHHAWGRTYKDLFQRFKAMQGHELRWQYGFDCQGLWVEREEEKDLGLKDKEDIEKYGILNFVKACKARVEKFSKIQQAQSTRLGMWADWDVTYYTMTDNNNLHNWFLLKTYYNKGWLYKGHDSVPWCWRCGTASSKHDIVTEGYKEVAHKAVFMQFPVKGKDNEYFMIFTTTPWTIPANVLIAVNENLDYVLAENNSKRYWLAESLLKELEGDYDIIEKKKGAELKDMEYIMPYQDLEEQKEAPHRVVLWDLASGEEGTGIVHIAPGCGAEDHELGKKLGVVAISPLDGAGVYKEGFGEWSLRKYQDVNKAVLVDMETRDFVYKIVSYTHRYPHCWRCGEELVFRLVDEWYIKGDDIRSDLIKANKNIKWFPEYGGVRQEDWFKNMSDWLISRKRYWGLPLPIWECECGELHVYGSLDELKKDAIDPSLVDNLQEVHRPYVDEIKIKCRKCEKEVERIKDVGDAWLDAGIVPFSAMGPYLDNKKEWEKWFPADLISENMPGQYRGWFNAISWSSMTLAGKLPFKSMFGYETLKDEKGEEMHKSKGNAIWFDDVIEKIGADPMRLLYSLQNPAQELRFGFNVLREPANNLNILYNMGRLVSSYGDINELNVEDKWIMSKYNSLISTVTKELEDLHPHFAMRALQNFWLNDLSRGYIQFIRDRLALQDDTTHAVLREVYLGLLRLCAPFIPFITEKAYQELRNKVDLKESSVHLCGWPVVDKNKIDVKLEESFDVLKQIIEQGMAERNLQKIGLRWPLAKITVKGVKSENSLKGLLLTQLNIKDVNFVAEEGFKVELDTTMTTKLEQEGFYRELSRAVQAARKKAGLKREDSVDLFVDSEVDLKRFKKELMERCGAKNLQFNSVNGADIKIDLDIKGKKIRFGFNKV